MAVRALVKLWVPEQDGAPPQLIGIQDERFVVEEEPQPVIPFDNRHGTSPYAVKRTFTAEWSQVLEVRHEEGEMTRTGLSVGSQGTAKLEAVAQQAIKDAYSISDSRRESRNDEVSFEVPAGVRREVRVVHRRIWRRGVMRFVADDIDAGIPFRVLENVEFGYSFHGLG